MIHRLPSPLISSLLASALLLTTNVPMHAQDWPDLARYRVANAALDSIPMVVIAGDIPSYYYGRHPHQEFNLHQDADQFQIYRPFCKRVYRVDNVRDLPRIVERAFHLCQTGRPGPVFLEIAADVLFQRVDRARIAFPAAYRPHAASAPAAITKPPPPRP